MTVYPIRDVVPHRASLLLLDELVHWDDDSIHAALVVPSKGAFAGPDGVPAWIGIEYMAQAIAAWAGCRARHDGGEPKIGFLLGSRRYSSQRDLFPAGTRLEVYARRELMGDNGLGMFACRIDAGGETWVEANVSVFEPADAQAYLESGTA